MRWRAGSVYVEPDGNTIVCLYVSDKVMCCIDPDLNKDDYTRYNISNIEWLLQRCTEVL